jgi:L-lysine 6-oxidase
MSLKISPSVGVARLGNSADEFMIAPDQIGGLPFDYDMPTGVKGAAVQQFKDSIGLVKRQGQVFKVYDGENELVIGVGGVKAFHWTVHLANKKAAWYQYTELRGNLLYPDNEYTMADGGPDDVEVRNPSTIGPDRNELVIDAGPRTISGINQRIELDDNKKGLRPLDYKTSFPVYPDIENINGLPVTSLGTICTDANGCLIVFGAYGAAGGIDPLTSYGGSDTWHDDIADGSISCMVEYEVAESETIENRSWLIVGSPDFAPEIVNISTLSDTMFDVAIRAKNLNPAMHDGTDYVATYLPEYNQEILPILERCRAYQWVANVQSMTAFAYPTLDLSDPATNMLERADFFAYFRAPNDKSIAQPDQSQGVLFNNPSTFDIPKMPINSGSNSVSNKTVVKFLALDETQYFLMEQWSKSLFINDKEAIINGTVDVKDQISAGNCVGLPMSPGIEVTWSVQNPAIYAAAYQISVDTSSDSGLESMRDECDPENASCQPGDLTKRMACPWQADFFQCTVQYINFDHPAINKAEKITTTTTTVVESWDPAVGVGDYEREEVAQSTSNQPLPPSYYSYWWPPQSPWDVLTGEHTLDGQEDSHLPAGQQVNYARGINSFVQMVEHWYALAFIRNNNPETNYPYFTETERNNLLFNYKEVGVGQITGNPEDSDTTIPVFYLEKDREKMSGKGADEKSKSKSKLFVAFLEKRAFKAISVTEEGLGLPKSGRRSRR